MSEFSGEYPARVLDDAGFAMVSMNGSTVFVDAAKGTDFRTDMLRIQADLLPVYESYDEPVSNRTVARLNRSAERFLQSSVTPIALDALISVEGSGLYLADEQRPDGSVEVGILTPQRRMFGQLFGVCFNEYPYVPNITEIPPNHDEPIPVRSREGMVMILGSVLLCGTEDDGTLEEIISYAHVPLAEDSLVVAKAEIFG